MNKPRDIIRYCERCGKGLADPVWLELDQNSGLYYPPGQLPGGAVSQGGFPFGPDCAKAELRKTR